MGALKPAVYEEIRIFELRADVGPHSLPIFRNSHIWSKEDAMGLGNFLRDAAFVKGGEILGIAEALDQRGFWGPAYRYYSVARDKLNFGGAHIRNLQYIDRAMARCSHNVSAAHEQLNIAFQAPTDEVLRNPDLFVTWYYACQKQHGEIPWGEFVRQYIADQSAREEAARREKRRLAEQAIQAAQKEFERDGQRLFAQRWAQLMEEARRSADGSQEALTRAVGLWRRPKNRTEDYWQKGWTAFARDSLQRLLASRGSEEQQKVIRLLPKIARKAECGFLSESVGGLIFVCMLYPVFLGLFAFTAWILPDNPNDMGILRALCCAAVGLLGLLFGLIQWVLKWVSIPIVMIWLGVLLFGQLPKFLRMRRMLQSDDPAALPIQELFEAGDGLPLAAGEPK
jgi:hypothetical protein